MEEEEEGAGDRSTEKDKACGQVKESDSNEGAEGVSKRQRHMVDV